MMWGLKLISVLHAAQTYLRGFKISLSEVEAALMACVGVEDSRRAHH